MYTENQLREISHELDMAFDEAMKYYVEPMMHADKIVCYMCMLAAIDSDNVDIIIHAGGIHELRVKDA